MNKSNPRDAAWDRLPPAYVETFKTWLKEEVMIAHHRGDLPAEQLDFLMAHFALAAA